MLWEALFWREHEQEAQAETLSEISRIHRESVDRRLSDVARLEQRVARLELALVATTRLLELRTGIKREELALMIQQIDLADGVEDGRIGPDRTTEAPRCPHCGRPVNPRRAACVYCNAPLEPAAEAKGGPYRGAAPPDSRRARAPEMVTCTRCGVELPLDQSDLSTQGIVCPKCSRIVNA